MLMKSKTLSLPQSESEMMLCPPPSTYQPHSVLPCSLIKLLPVLPGFSCARLRKLGSSPPAHPSPLLFSPWLNKLNFNLPRWGIWPGLRPCVCLCTSAECCSCTDRMVLFLDARLCVFPERLMSDRGVGVKRSRLQLLKHVVRTAGYRPD